MWWRKGRADVPKPAKPAREREDERRLRDALLELPEQERTVLSLYYFEELKLNDIARILEVSESRVSQIRSKAIQRLRRRLPLFDDRF